MTDLAVQRSVQDALAESRGRIRRCEANELPPQAILVDLRSHDERERDGIIPCSLHVPRSVLEWRVDVASGYANANVADRTLELVLICAEGYSSSLAAAGLQELGFERAGDLVGGFDAWCCAGLPVVPAPAPAPGLPGMGGTDR